MEQLEEDDEKSYTDIHDMFADFEKEDQMWREKHPFRAHIRDWLDERFPKGIAGGKRAYYVLFFSPWEIFTHARYEIKYAWQRVFRGWDDTAVWDINHYLAELIPQLVIELKENGNGLPMFAFEGMEPDENYNYTEEQMKAASERWDKVLDEIADGFKSYIKFDEKSLRPEDYEKDDDYQKFQKGFELLKEHWGSFWD